MQEQFFSSPDGTRLRFAHFHAATEQARGTVLFLEGRRECIEIYLEPIVEWTGRGFDVFVFDWRGQGGSDRPLADPHKHHVRSFDDYRNDLQAFAEAVVRPQQRGPLIVFGHSMGGFVALDWLIQERPNVAAAILAAPMLALPVSSWMHGTSLGLCHMAMRLGFAESYTPGEGRFDPACWSFENNPLTQDPERFQLILHCFTARPELAIGGVTYGWLGAALEALIRVRPRLGEVSVPTLLLNSGQDRVTLSHEVSYWAQNIPAITEKIHPSARHDIMAETDDIRLQVWRDIDAFLAQIDNVAPQDRAFS